MTPLTTLTVPTAFRGPPDSGNGGWTCGSFAGALGWDGPVEVTLRMPPPLDAALDVVELEDGTAELRYREHVIATARRGELSVGDAPVVDLTAAMASQSSYDGLVEHPFPGCFVCGPARSHADALVLLPGPVGDGVVAAPWQVQDWAATTACAWAALDCPTGWAIGLVGRPAVLGRMTTEVLRAPAPGEQCVVVGERLSRDGRKAFARGALRAAGGELIARSATTWIEVDPTTIRPPS